MRIEKRLLSGGAVLLILSACHKNSSNEHVAAETGMVINLENRSHQIVTGVRVFSVTQGRAKDRLIFSRREMFVQSGVDQIIFLPKAKQCELSVSVDYLSGYTVDMPGQNFCQKSTLSLAKKDGKPPRK